MSQLKVCPACDDYFEYDDRIVEVNDKFYHDKCVELYPTGYVAYLNDEFLGETENEDGQSAYDFLEEGEYIDVEDEE